MKTRKAKIHTSLDPAVEQPANDATAGKETGDLQGLSGVEEADSESVSELVEEGQAFEAGVIDGIENAPDADVAGIKTREFPEDDVPSEYLDND